MIRRFTYLLIPVLFGACVSEIEKEGNNETEKAQQMTVDTVNVLDSAPDVQNKKELENGIVIKWFEHGKGEKIKDGDCIKIDYKVQLDDGNVVDGNHLLNKPNIPFVVGFGMQTPGWDIALKELTVGDFVEVFIPSALARGEKGIKDLIPPNANNILRIRVISLVKPTREIDGNKVWLFEENPNMTEKFNETNEIEFHCMVSTPSNSFYVNTFRENNPFKLRLEDGGLVPGLKKALVGAKRSDRMFILVPSKEAYGSRGYQDVVKPGEDILYNVLVMDVHE